ncbi:lipid storage droplets surface-binding protein 2-like [Leptopilina heterotoma]|uniref:lipid storage droplets surface-binding protein 2-like n=1 Tax=Leptopilina heterotoma TaxID=63436 RepID=UPI001CA9537A|nr:lipid storage droplets surface-binding protein 2-like [Leptopilina heterotoma]
MTTDSQRLPQMEIFHRVLDLPTIEFALSKSASTYSRVKDSYQLLNWALSTAEYSLTRATKQAVPIAVPIARKFKTPIHFVDHTLCLGLNKIEEKVPLVKEQPEQILENAYMLALQTMQPAVSTISHANDLIISQATSLKEISWNKVNQILSTHYGSVAVQSIDSTAIIVDKLIDRYFPPIEEEQISESIIAEDDKLLHTLQTMGRISNKAARRVYANVVYHYRTLNKDTLKAYVGSLVEFLHITRYLHGINGKVQTIKTPPTKSKEKTN